MLDNTCLNNNKREWNKCFIKSSTSVTVVEFFANLFEKTFSPQRNFLSTEALDVASNFLVR